jgi:hypothetical protein
MAGTKTIQIIQDSTKLSFISWRGMIQPVKPVLEIFNRLGSSEVSIQELRKESQITQATAVSTFSTQQDMMAFVHSLASIVGKKAIWNDTNNTIVVDPIYVIDFSYTWQKCDGSPATGQVAQGGGDTQTSPTGDTPQDVFRATFQLSIINDTWNK